MVSRIELFKSFVPAIITGAANELHDYVTPTFTAQIPGGQLTDFPGFLDEVLSWPKLLPGFGRPWSMQTLAEQGETMATQVNTSHQLHGDCHALTVMIVAQFEQDKIAELYIILNSAFGATAEWIGGK